METKTLYRDIKVLYDVKDYISGAHLSNKLLVADPDSLELQMLLAEGYLQLGLNEKALISLEYAYNNILHSDPLLAELYFMLGGAHASLGNLEDAIMYLKRAERLTPQNPLVLRQLGFEMFWAGEENEGLMRLEKANAIKPKDPDILGDLSVCCANTGQNEEAIQYANEAIDAGNDHMRVFLDKLTRSHG